MTAATPLSAEMVQTREQAAQRIRQMGAMRYDNTKSTFNKWIYWNGRDRVWIVVTPVRGGFKIETYKTCPC